MSASLKLRPITWRAAVAWIREYHRHHAPPRGWICGVAVERDGDICGVIVIGRPVARALQDGYTAEVTRCCTDGTPNAPSMLYGAAWRAARALGYRRMVTYTLDTEPGTSLRAAGWREMYTVRGRSWTTPSRPRTDNHPTVDKRCWGIGDWI